MAAVLRDTTLYDNLHVKKYLSDARDRDGRVVPIPFEVTIASPATTGDTYNMCVLPANCEVVGLEFAGQAFSASAGVGTTFALGDSGSANRFMIAADVDAAESHGVLAFAGQRFRPTADTIVVGTLGGTVTAVAVGKKAKGCFYVVPGA